MSDRGLVLHEEDAAVCHRFPPCSGFRCRYWSGPPTRIRPPHHLTAAGTAGGRCPCPLAFGKRPLYPQGPRSCGTSARPLQARKCRRQPPAGITPAGRLCTWQPNHSPAEACSPGGDSGSGPGSLSASLGTGIRARKDGRTRRRGVGVGVLHLRLGHEQRTGDWGPEGGA